MSGWAVVRGKNVAVVPTGDIHEHHADSKTCPCQPRVEEPTGPPWKALVVHKSFDAREYYEHDWVPNEKLAERAH